MNHPNEGKVAETIPSHSIHFYRKKETGFTDLVDPETTGLIPPVPVKSKMHHFYHGSWESGALVLLFISPLPIYTGTTNTIVFLQESGAVGGDYCQIFK